MVAGAKKEKEAASLHSPPVRSSGQQIIAGKTSREIADFYGIGSTVEFHRANVMAKLGATNTAELIGQAQARGMI